MAGIACFCCRGDEALAKLELFLIAKLDSCVDVVIWFYVE